MKQLHGHFALSTSTRLLLSSIAAITLSTSIQADEALENITVTANRMPSVNVLAPNSVITRADIERLQITDLPNLLSRQPGIDLTVNGGIGKESNISMRGTNSDNVLVLVDGVKWHSATSGGPSLQHFPIEQIERVEIVRGSRSGLYGSEAIGGVIQIFTRKGQQGVSPYARIGYGTHNSKQAAAGVSGGNAQTSYNLNFNHQSTDGIDARQNRTPANPNINPDRDGYRNNSLSARVQHQISDTFNVGANFLRTEGFNEYDGIGLTNVYEDESVQQVMGLNSNIQANDNWLVSLLLSESKDETQIIKNGLDENIFNTRHRFANIINTIELSQNHTLNIGFDYVVDDIGNTASGGLSYDENSRDNKAGYISWQGNADKHSWLLSARHDDNEAFGNYDTGIAEWGYWLQEGLQLTANVGTAFKAPTFNDLYFPQGTFFVGNPALKPEKSRNYGLGLTADTVWGQWGLQAYQTEVRDLINYDSANGMNENVAEAKIKGLEFDLATTIADWDVAFNASLLKPEDEETGDILRRRAQRLANLNLDKQWGAWSTGASWKLRGHSFDNASNTTRVAGFGLLDMRIAYDLSQDWSLQANLTNVFDKEYQTVNNYNSLDRMVMVMFSYQP
jgi:vitamin B12 transporter